MKIKEKNDCGKKWYKVAILRYISIFLVLMCCVSILSAKEVIYRDDMGRKVKIPIGVKRGVFIAPIPDLIPALNLWDRVVGINRRAYEENELMKAFKTKWKDTILSVGGVGRDINIEVLLKLKPDFIIAPTFYPEVVEFIEKKGLRVIGIFLENLPAELYDLINLCGKVFEREKEAKRTIEWMERIFKLVKERTGKIPVDKKKTVIWLLDIPTHVACKGSTSAEILNNINVINPAYNTRWASWSGRVEASIERIITWNPDVIFILQWAKYNADDILNNPQWRSIKAVKDGKVYKAPPAWSGWSPIIAPLSLWAASKVYPEYFKDVDVEKICNDFYKEVFGIPYSKVKSLVSPTVK